jgi:hypothetical protein
MLLLKPTVTARRRAGDEGRGELAACARGVRAKKQIEMQMPSTTHWV